MVSRNRILTALAGLVFAAASLPAQNNIAEIAGGYTYVKANPVVALAKQGMNGWMVGAGGYPGRWFGVGFEISAAFGSINGPSGGNALNFKEYSYLVGPQFRFIDKQKVQSNFKFLLGGVFGQARLDSSITPVAAQTLSLAGYNPLDATKFAMLMSVPVDYSVTKAIGIRVEPGLYVTGFAKARQSNFRFSVGPVFRFGAR
ncbi:MAG TPA: hypothetical protein VE959_29440 [Bryobacteraceae bacterium]|nr:hypothetical protein [Bryobacteraceae bacterium]